VSGRLVLVRHGQSLGNVDKRLDTRPPGAPLTDLGHEQARRFAQNWHHPVGMIAHSTALRAMQTATEIGEQVGMAIDHLEGIHEVQVGELENRNDEAAIREFEAIYERWQMGELDVPMPGGETGQQVLDRYLPAITQLRLRHLDDHGWKGDIVVASHGAAIRLVAAVLAGVDGSFVLEHHLANTESVVLSPITDGRWSCVQWGALTPPFHPEPRLHPAEDALLGVDPMG
jgi:broad specificity phosphatase PhoE